MGTVIYIPKKEKKAMLKPNEKYAYIDRWDMDKMEHFFFFIFGHAQI
jgi:hypothetical protein